MRVLLIWPNSRNELLGWGDLGAVAEPLALEYLASGLALDGHQIKLLDLRLHPSALTETLQCFDPDAVGVTGFSMHVRTARGILATVKAWRADCVTVAGGHHATLLPEDFFEDTVDYVVCGEGIGPLRALCRRLQAGDPGAGVAGVWQRTAAGFVDGGPPPAFLIDDLPFPDRNISVADRPSYFIDWMRPVALLRSTVGCPYRCTFCSLWKIMDGRYHKRSVDLVVEELRQIEEDWVFLVDDEAFIDGRRMLKLAQGVKKANIHKRLFAYCRIDTLLRSREVMMAWREIGLERLFIGIDAISGKDLSEYNKRCEPAEIEAGLALARQLGIEVFAQFVVNTDYDRRDFQRLARFIEHHRIDYPSFTVLTPIPGTDLLGNFDSVIERQPNGRPNWDLFDCQNAVTRTRLPKDEFRREYRKLYKLFKGAYSQYREHNRVIQENDLRAAPTPVTFAAEAGR